MQPTRHIQGAASEVRNAVVLRQYVELVPGHLSEQTQEWLTDQGCANAAGLPFDDSWDVSLHMGAKEKGWTCRVPAFDEQTSIPADLAVVCDYARGLGANYILVRD